MNIFSFESLLIILNFSIFARKKKSLGTFGKSLSYKGVCGKCSLSASKKSHKDVYRNLFWFFIKHIRT